MTFARCASGKPRGRQLSKRPNPLGTKAFGRRLRWSWRICRIADAGSNAIEALRRAAAGRRMCPLWENATQTVFGEGAHNADIMFVGEQPGDRQDRAGRPFVGPAGQMFDKALGATAARSLGGQNVAIAANRSKTRFNAKGLMMFVTTHPSALLRMPEEAAREAAYAEFVKNMRAVAALSSQSGRPGAPHRRGSEALLFGDTANQPLEESERSLVAS